MYSTFSGSSGRRMRRLEIKEDMRFPKTGYQTRFRRLPHVLAVVVSGVSGEKLPPHQAGNGGASRAAARGAAGAPRVLLRLPRPQGLAIIGESRVHEQLSWATTAGQGRHFKTYLPVPHGRGSAKSTRKPARVHGQGDCCSTRCMEPHSHPLRVSKWPNGQGNRAMDHQELARITENLSNAVNRRKRSRSGSPICSPSFPKSPQKWAQVVQMGKALWKTACRWPQSMNSASGSREANPSGLSHLDLRSLRSFGTLSAAVPTVSRLDVKPGPPAATYPRLAPDSTGLTQNE